MGFFCLKDGVIINKQLQKTILITSATIAALFLYVLVHEATHLLLADEARGICIGKCHYNSDQATPSTGYAIATAAGNHNPTSRREDLPAITGLVATTSFLAINLVAIHWGEKGRV